MFSKIKEFFSSFASNAHDSLETYIMSKNVKTTSELEYWIRHYDQKNKSGFF